MYFTEAGIQPRSVRYLFTPFSMVERLLFYSTRIGHYFCDRNYHFRCDCEIAMHPGHRLHYMIFLVRQGMLELELEGKHYTASSGSVVLFDCKRPHEYRALTDDLEFYWMVFDGSSSEPFYEQLLEKSGDEHVLRVSDTPKMQLIFERLLTYGGLSAHRTEHVMAELIYSLLCMQFESEVSGDTFVGRALVFMDQHFAEQLSVEDIAEQVGLSPSYFTKHFRRQTGYSPHEYIVLRRIDHAKELLLSTDQTVSQITYASGYNSEENFVRSFKKKVGVSPTAYRKYPI